MTAYRKWIHPHYLVEPIRQNEIKISGPDGEKISLIIHHAFEQIREVKVVDVPHNPKYGPIRYKRMGFSDAGAMEMAKQVVPCEVEPGDILGVAPNQVRDGDDKRKHVWLDVNQDQEYYKVNFSSVFYWRKPDSEEIKLGPGWAVIKVDQKEWSRLGNLILLNQAYNKRPFEGTIKYVSEGKWGTKETLGLEVGDQILFEPKMNIAMEINGEALYMIAHSQIHAKKGGANG